MSTLTKAMFAFSGSLDAASKIGPNARHGPHQVAQKSTNTISLSVMVFSNSAEVMAVVAIEVPSSNTVLDAVYQFPSTTQHFGKSLCPKLNGLRAHGGDEALC